ncbi:MAG: hypothetical protein IKR46_04150 [Clostridia bacterium]|nr:hypothetical protein [Clostridia bacterium]
MKKLRKLLFLALFLLYTAGVFIGAVREAKLPNEAEMYEYLENGIEGYDTEPQNGIKTALKDNGGMLVLAAVGGFFKPLVWLLALSVLIKGYLTGFSIMAALRLYGAKGIILCIPNIISAAILIPSVLCYGGIIAGDRLGNAERRAFYRRFILATIFLAAIFCADAVIKGAVSPIFVKWASKLINAA